VELAQEQAVHFFAPKSRRRSFNRRPASVLEAHKVQHSLQVICQRDHTADGRCRHTALWQNPRRADPGNRRTHPGTAPDYPPPHILPTTPERAASASDPFPRDGSSLKQTISRGKRFPMTKEFSHRLAPEPTRDYALGSWRSRGLFYVAVPAWLSSSR